MNVGWFNVPPAVPLSPAVPVCTIMQGRNPLSREHPSVWRRRTVHCAGVGQQSTSGHALMNAVAAPRVYTYTMPRMRMRMRACARARACVWRVRGAVRCAVCARVCAHAGRACVRRGGGVCVYVAVLQCQRGAGHTRTSDWSHRRAGGISWAWMCSPTMWSVLIRAALLSCPHDTLRP